MNLFKFFLPSNNLIVKSNKLVKVFNKHPRIIGINSNCQFFQKSQFHLSTKRPINPLFWLLLKPLSRVVTIFSGRRIRFWWRKLSAEEKIKYKRYIKDNPATWFVPLSLLIIGTAFYYSTHMQNTPITGRRRFMAMTLDQIHELSNLQLKTLLEENEKNILPTSNKMYGVVGSIVNRLVENNKDVESMINQKWTIYIIESNESQAFVLPTGHIFIHTGIGNMISNDDQLAFIIAHEMSHALLCHAVENINFVNLIDIIVIMFLAAIWAIMPTDILAVVANYFFNKVIQIMINLPYSRKLEIEADKVGLQLIAKACYDVRESSVLWQNWSKILNSDENVEIPQFLSTHPSFDNRTKLLDDLMPQAIILRKKKKVPTATLR